jgi:hypothetical protein
MIAVWIVQSLELPQASINMHESNESNSQGLSRI